MSTTPESWGFIHYIYEKCYLVFFRPKSIFSIHHNERDDTASLSFPDDEDSGELRLSFDNS